MQAIQILYVLVNSFLQNFLQSESGFNLTLSRLNSRVIVQGNGHGMAKFLEIFKIFRTQFWLYLIKIKINTF